MSEQTITAAREVPPGTAGFKVKSPVHRRRADPNGPGGLSACIGGVKTVLNLPDMERSGGGRGSHIDRRVGDVDWTTSTLTGVYNDEIITCDQRWEQHMSGQGRTTYWYECDVRCADKPELVRELLDRFLSRGYEVMR